MAQRRHPRPAAETALEATLAPTLLESISACCRRSGMAESTFGRRAVNDGKFVSRLRDGARITPETLQRVNQFMVKHGAAGAGDAPPRAAAADPRERLPRAPTAAARGAAGAELPLLRQPAEVPAVRQHLQREGRGGEPRRARAGHIHPRRPRCACSTPAWATARCSRASCARCTGASRRCRSTSWARRSASRTCACPCARWSTASTSIRRPCWW